MEDLRIRRTYKLLKDALFELLSKKSFDEIKVNDICNVAMVHRTTFYSHFSDKYELLDFCIKDVETELTCKMKQNSYTNAKEFYTNLIMCLLNYIAENKNFFKSILKRNSNNAITNIFLNACISYIESMLMKEEENGFKHEIPKEIISRFYSGAVISTIIWWLKSNSELTEKDLCNYIMDLITIHNC